MRADRHFCWLPRLGLEARRLETPQRDEDDRMLTVTDAALQHLHDALSEANAVEDACFRFTRQAGDAVGLIVQDPESDDQTFECHGDTVLAAPQPLVELLSTKVLDLDDGRLVLIPQAA
jgi:hypothetical protein